MVVCAAMDNRTNMRRTQSIVRNASKCFPVADATKFGMAAPAPIVSFAEPDGFVTDGRPPKAIVQVRTVAPPGRAP